MLLPVNCKPYPVSYVGCCLELVTVVSYWSWVILFILVMQWYCYFVLCYWFMLLLIQCRGPGRQCCYDERGRLIMGPGAGGHSDLSSPYSQSLLPSFVLRLHLQRDITPFLHCCKSSESSCTTFYTFRPSAVSECQYLPTPSGRFYWLVLSVHAPMRVIRM